VYYHTMLEVLCNLKGGWTEGEGMHKRLDVIGSCLRPTILLLSSVVSVFIVLVLGKT